MTDRSVSQSIDIDAPAATVFAIVADPRQHARIDGSGTLRECMTGPDRLELGSKFGMAMKMGTPYRISSRVVEYEPDRLIAWRHIGAHRWRYEFEPLPAGGTRVTETWDLAPYPAFIAAALSAIFGKKTVAAVAATLVKLKAAAEADARKVAQA